MYQYRNNQTRTTYRVTVSADGTQVTIAPGETVSLNERLSVVPGFLEDLNAPEEKPVKKSKKAKKVTKDEATDDKTSN
tara:strand:- start:424 stop:657 length:234 start_codon:yes stop_codon:yes gene_type:complete